MSVKTLGDLLEIAIQHEVSSQKFYQDSLEKTSDLKVQNFLKSLIEEEKGHERILLNIRQMEIYDDSVTVDENLVNDALHSQDIEIPDLSMEPALEEIYEIALKRETKAYNIFKQMAATVKNDELRDLFENLADEELNHHKNINNKYHAQTGQMGYEG
ncbi:MAG: ferritin family protein [Candidatus Heimdallarchaeota archaeon]|nr:ferritin family protein [Candidatus Heimdallarchaeota archaeon]